MSGNILQFVQEQKKLISVEKQRLGLMDNSRNNEIGIEKKSLNLNLKDDEKCDNDGTWNNNYEQSPEANKENVQLNSNCVLVENDNKTLPNVEPLEIISKHDSTDVSLEDKKQAFVNKLVSSEIPLSDRSNDCVQGTMLRYGEYSPNNPQIRVTAAPYLGFGEYDQRRNYFLQKQRADYLTHIAKQQESVKKLTNCMVSNRDNSANYNNTKYLENKRFEKSVQTDIQNIKIQLLQYDLRCQRTPEKELSSNSLNEDYYMKKNRNLSPFRVDQRLTSAQNALLKSEMDKPRSILSNKKTGSPRERLMSDLYSSSFTDGFVYRESRADELERERLKREAYQRELRLQIEEKRRLQQMREEQEMKERELENKRLEQQLLRMQEERMIEEQFREHKQEQMRRHSEDLLRRKQELQTSRYGFRKHTNSECSIHNNATDISSKSLSHYSPPVSRRNPYSYNVPSTSVFSELSSTRYNPNRFDSYHRRDALKRMDSLNSSEPPNRHQMFNRFDSLSKIDSLSNRLESMSLRNGHSGDVQRRHSATHQDLSLLRKSPRLQRRSSSSRFDDGLPVPLLKAHSPVAKELKNSVPFNSTRSRSEAIRRLEDRWQIPAVQKSILNHTESPGGQNRSILTQLGAIRLQLQQEQLRMDESLRRRDVSQSKAVDFL
ncbi:trichohyalin isoform X1 [Diorhabda sublineata]|uniref:trichohyalin isoform X1 n=1 Tax=Diorhabda sublineata TaxID=1163346 RepID=UPI0024E0B590|nr:trichohyalin isoform X1 [Diorhabda sublineata]